MSTVVRQSPCKVNLLLNILRRREDGFHELETVMQPVQLCDRLTVEKTPSGVTLTCSNAALPVDGTNLVQKAATAFLGAAAITDGVKIHLEKNIPLAAGLGGGSGNAAHTLGALNELFDLPLSSAKLTELAAALGSDVPFFLQSQPALAYGRGELVQPLAPFPALRGAHILLIHPGFGISTAWAYQSLAKFPDALHGKVGRAQQLIGLLQGADLAAVGRACYNSLEAPALPKHPLLALYQEILRANGAPIVLMSGSGSTTFAVVASRDAAERLRERFLSKFGLGAWTAVAAL
ncbi:MAG: 4-diphosphocytidyl-2-C-methyl-D-erythritol kinase [Limisphaerales bacterium]|nr:MAG: 4-diphosphocytidyl-2-C-methyl-D-erythritol kinase [Limisphaerales bacterium]KAG0507300.1 MAG: 4-diphosphocytidyl-2-C-methyl-D-erythritol kinase [Limisphaerales bacterium]TXT44760.1 MAG: 4-diphosphocytidyl-2-C-methyl-D-erythritol kinase [Limisphaerales bacterium]